MMGLILAAIQFIISCLAITLRKIYLENPAIESNVSNHPALKTRSIKSTKREHVLGAFLRLLAILTFAGFLIIIENHVSSAAYFAVLVASLWYVFAYLPAKDSSNLSISFANLLSPGVIALLNKTKNQTRFVENILSRRKRLHKQIKALNKSEIIELLKSQKTLYEGRSLGRDLANTINFIDLASNIVGELMQPIEEALLVNESENVGPILIDELHKTKRKIFLVRGHEREIVGTVSLDELVELTDGGRVKSVIKSGIVKVRERDNILVAIEKFAEKPAGIYEVVDDNNKTTGVLYLEDVLSRLFN